jgi:uncharacterized protein YoxC
MSIPVVDGSEHYNHEELVQQVRVLKAQMRVVGTATEDVLLKHNTFVGDVEQGMNGLMATTSQQFVDMARLKDGCQVIEGEVRALHGACAGFQVHNEQVEHAFVVFRTEYGEKLDLIAKGAQSFEQQVRDMEKGLNAKVEKMECETVPADLRRAHAGMAAELAKFRAEHTGSASGTVIESKITKLIAEALGSETFEGALVSAV